MNSLDKEVLEFLYTHPLLSDETFLGRFPGVIGVSSFIHANARTMMRMRGNYELFERMNITTTSEYISLLNNEDREAVRIYEKLQGIFTFSS